MVKGCQYFCYKWCTVFCTQAVYCIFLHLLLFHYTSNAVLCTKSRSYYFPLRLKVLALYRQRERVSVCVAIKCRLLGYFHAYVNTAVSCMAVFSF